MAQGQMQLAMKETVVRKRRYVRAIRWLIDNLTEDAEIEKFLSAKPGSFNTGWGMEVWKRMGKYHESEGKDRVNLLRLGDHTGIYTRVHPTFIFLEHMQRPQYRVHLIVTQDLMQVYRGAGTRCPW